MPRSAWREAVTGVRHRWVPFVVAGLFSTTIGTMVAPTRALAGPPPWATATPFAAFDAVVAERVLGTRNVSVSLAIARNGRVVHTAAFGPADPATGARADRTTAYRVASISKTFAALAVWRLAAEHRIDLDGAVLPLLAGRLPDPAVSDARVARITVRQLLTQSSGLPTAWGMYFAKGAARSCPEAATRALSGRLADDPGVSYRYSNTNYCILGLVIEAITGEPFEDYVARTVLAPFGVVDAHASRAPDDYRAGDARQPAPADSASLAALGAAGEWVATPTDLVRVVDALARPGCTSPYPSPAVLTARPGAWVKPEDTDWYGLGVMVWDGGTRWGHSGTIEGGRAIVEHDADGTTWAIAVSGTQPRTGEALRDIVRDALDRLPPGVASAAPVCAAAPPRRGPR